MTEVSGEINANPQKSKIIIHSLNPDDPDIPVSEEDKAFYNYQKQQRERIARKNPEDLSNNFQRAMNGVAEDEIHR